jgi:hypothetical protein
MEEMEQPFKVALIDLLKEKGTTAVARETSDASVAAGRERRAIGAFS